MTTGMRYSEKVRGQTFVQSLKFSFRCDSNLWWVEFLCRVGITAKVWLRFEYSKSIKLQSRTLGRTVTACVIYNSWDYKKGSGRTYF